jgi:hypothetical protein
MAIERYLTTDEKILASAGDLYATNKRIIKYRKNILGEELHDLFYPHLTSISYINRSRRGWLDLGSIVSVLGIVGIVVNIFLEHRLVTPLSGVGVGVGVLLMLIGIFVKVTYVQFRGAGVSDAAGKWLRIGNVNSKDAKLLVTLVREHTK